jgi:hypothetical protein
MTPLLLQRPQPSRNSVSPLVKAAQPNLEPRLTRRSDVPAGGWRRFGGPPPGSCGGWWDQIGDRTRRPEALVLRSGYVRGGLNSLHSRLGAPLRRLSRPARLPRRVKRHLPHLAHPVF